MELGEYVLILEFDDDVVQDVIEFLSNYGLDDLSEYLIAEKGKTADFEAVEFNKDVEIFKYKVKIRNIKGDE